MAVTYKDLRQSAYRLHEEWVSEKPAFELRTGWASSYDDLFDERFEQTFGEKEVLAFVQSSGRAILSGRGGSGKTQLLRRLYGVALEVGALPIYIDLKQWAGSDYEQWQEWTAGDLTNGGDFLLRKFGSLKLGALELDRVPPNVRKFIIVDGLNEMAASVGSEILVLLDEIVRNQMSASVIVADRLIRRALPNESRWGIGTTLPLSNSEIRRHLGTSVQLADHDIRTSPFFLNVQIKDGTRRQNQGRAAALEQWLREHSTLSSEELAQASAAAFHVYVDEQCRSRLFSTRSFSGVASEPTTDKLSKSGVLVSSNGVSHFGHHIVHDFLASRHLAEHGPGLWNPKTFRAVTFEGSSIDPLELAFEQLNVDRGELFLRALYDWHLYAAGYVLGNAGSVGHSVGREMRTVICAMLAEKRFDSILATREQALDALRLIPTDEARAFRSAVGISDICDLLMRIEAGSNWFADWRRLYCVLSGGEFNTDMLHAITEADSVIGWTVANVVRRFVDLDWAVPELRKLLESELNATVRWRAAHVLGKVPTRDSAESLMKAIVCDSDIDVRFGAVRSLIEVSLGSDPETRTELGRQLEALAPTIALHPRLSRELRACLLADPRDTPPDWLDFVRKCVRSQFISVDTPSEKDVWRGRLFAAEALYSGTTGPSVRSGT